MLLLEGLVQHQLIDVSDELIKSDPKAKVLLLLCVFPSLQAALTLNLQY